MKLRFYKSTNIETAEYLDIEVFDPKVSRELCNKDELKCRVESETPIDFNFGWCVLVETDKLYQINELPSYEQKSTILHTYDLTLQGAIHDLSKIAFLDADGNSDFFLNGKIEDFIALIVSNMNGAGSEIASVWAAGTYPETEYKNIQFSGQNSWAALNAIADEFDLEFEVKQVSGVQQISFAEQIGNSTSVSIALGKGKGLESLKRTNIDTDKLITRLYYFGSNQNLPSGYAYDRLRGSNAYLELNKDKYGRRDGYKIFEDVKPRFVGSVASFEINGDGENVMTDSAFPFNLIAVDSEGNDLYLVSGTTAKISFLTGDCAGYSFDIVAEQGFDWNSGTGLATIKLIEYKQENGYGVPNNYVKPKAGDTYTILDIKMPDSYLTNAVSNLDAAALEYLQTYASPRVQYSASSDKKYFSANNVILKIGDRITINDTDLDISQNCRVTQYEYPLQDKYDVDFSLTDVRFAIPHRKLKMQMKKLEILTDVKKLSDVQSIMKNMKSTNELKNRVFTEKSAFDVDLSQEKAAEYFIPENNAPESLDPYMLALDSGEIQYSLKGVEMAPLATGLSWTAGQVIHHSYYGRTRAKIAKMVANSETYDPTRTWTMAAGSLTVTGDTTEFFVYLKLPTTEGATTAQIIASEYHLPAKSQEGYILYKLGSLGRLSNDSRKLKLLWNDSGTATVVNSTTAQNVARTGDVIIEAGENQRILFSTPFPENITNINLVYNIWGHPDFSQIDRIIDPALVDREGFIVSVWNNARIIYQAIPVGMLVKTDNPVQITGIHIPATSWTQGTQFWEYTIENSAIEDKCSVEVITENSCYNTVASAGVLQQNDSTEGQVTIYSINQPLGDIEVSINIYKILSNPGILVIDGLTLFAANWTQGTQFWEYGLSNVNITSNSIVEVIPDNASYQLVASAGILSQNDSTEGQVTIYAVSQPTNDISITINIIEKL